MRGGPTPWVAFGTAPTTELFAVGIGHAGRSADRPLRAGHKVSVVGDDNWVAGQGPGRSLGRADQMPAAQAARSTRSR